MLFPAWLAVATRVPVAPATVWVDSDKEAMTVLLDVFAAVASHRPVMPVGGATVPSAATAARWTSRAFGTVVVIPGAGTAVDDALTAPSTASRGWAVSTPAKEVIPPARRRPDDTFQA